ncbi:beta-N-acetylhexosaminidase [Oleiphilus sp. HI0130]|nr:beta-N-acetylhexosaminidase [Oleiphilus sp. HI0130]
MHIEPKLGPVMIDFEGIHLTTSEISRLVDPLVGGVILCTRNFESQAQLASLIGQIRAARRDVIIAVDHEGGRVQRFREGFTKLPCMQTLGMAYEINKENALRDAKELGWLMASELRAFDIDISFAPVMDRDYGISDVIGDRAFSSDPTIIVALCSAFIAGMHEAGMASTGKHFPGHGAVSADSHVDIPVDGRSLEEITSHDMRIFKEMCEHGMDAVMPAHVIYPKVDDQPAGFSRIWIDILRNDCQFSGVIFSDDLSMEGATVAGGFEARADAALSAGCDMVLVCNNPLAADAVITHLADFESSAQSSARLTNMLGKTRIGWAELRQTERWRNAVKLANQLNSRGA